MSQRVGASAGRLRLVLVVVIGGALAQVMPSLLVTTVDAPSAVVLATLALALAAVVVLSSHRATFVPGALARQPGTADDTPPFLARRVTDPLHHPIRPRAPGLA